MTSDISKLLELPLFNDIHSDKLEAMLKCIGFHCTEYDKGEYIFLQNHEIQSIGIVLSGSVHLLLEDRSGNNSIITTSYAGDLFGETFICSGQLQSAISFVASSKSLILFMPFHRVMTSCTQVCPHHHKLIENMMIMLAEKNLKLMEKIEITSKKTLREKILTYLTLESRRSGSKSVKIPLSRGDLAIYLNADRTALSRELSNMKTEGIIDFDKKTFQIL